MAQFWPKTTSRRIAAAGCRSIQFERAGKPARLCKQSSIAVMAVGVALLKSASPADAQIHFQLHFPQLGQPQAVPQVPISEPGGYSLRPQHQQQPRGSQFPQLPCITLGGQNIDNLKPIDCVSGQDITAQNFHIEGLPLSVARPEVQTWIATVNDKIELARSGHRFSDDEVSDMRHWRNADLVETAIGYPSVDAYGSGEAANDAWQLHQSIDRAFISKGLWVLSLVANREMSQRESDKRQAEVRAEQDAETALFKRAARQCPGKILDYQDLALGSPFATTGHCYRLPILVVSQWLNSKTALANLAMMPVLIDFATPPSSQAMRANVIVRGEGAYQYSDTRGGLRTVPRVRWVTQ